MSPLATITSEAALSALKSGARKVGYTIPPRLDQELRALDALRGSFEAHRFDDAAFDHALVAAIEAERDPATDPAILEHLARHQLTHALGVSGRLSRAVEDRRAGLLAKHTPKIVESMRQVVAQIDETVHAAHAAIPGLRLDDHDLVTTLRPKQMRLWGEVRDARAKLQQLDRVLPMLLLATRLAPVSGQMRPLLYADLDADQLAGLSWKRWLDSLVEHGHRLSLADPTEFQRRSKKVRLDRSQAAEAKHLADAERRGEVA